MIAALFLRRALSSRNIVFDLNTQLHIIPHFTTSLLFTKSFASSESSQQAKEQSFTVSYLINSCGLSSESAKSVSKKVHFETPERPDSVLSFFKLHGFSKTHVSKIIRSRPRVLRSNAKKIFLPKFEFLCSIGASRDDIVKLFTLQPMFLEASLENFIIPCYNILKSILISNKKVIRTMQHATRSFSLNYLALNLEILRNVEVPQSCIVFMLSNSRATLFHKPSRFEEKVKQVQQLGIDPSKLVFVQAIITLVSLRRSNWESKFEVYGRWGWSKDDTLSAFKLFPQCMEFSEEKIIQMMEFLVDKMGWPSQAVAKCPRVLGTSFEKKIVPRCSVVQFLQKNGLMKKTVSLSTVLIITDERFMKIFVSKFEDIAPQLLNLYEGKVSACDLGNYSFEDVK